MLIHNADITGSLLVNGTGYNTGSFSGSFTGAVAGTTATASYVEYNSVANKPALVSGSSQITYLGLTGIPSGIVSGSSQVTYSGLTGIPSGIVSGSSQVTYSGLTGIPSGIVSGSAQVAGFGIFATTGSNQFNGSQVITGSLTVTGQVVAQTLNVQQVTSSIVYSSGSNVFGNSLANTQQFTGSVGVTGSLTVNGTSAVVGSGTTNYLPKFTAGSTIGNSQIFDNGTTVFVNATTAPSLGSPEFFVKMGTANTYEGILVASSTNNNVIAVAHTGTQGIITTNFGASGANTPLAFGTNGAGQMTLDTSGNLGLGVTPSAWRSTDKVLQINNTSLFDENGTNLWLGLNFFENTSGSYIFNNNGYATAYRQQTGQHNWFISTISGTAGNVITFTQAMTLDASGRLGIGTTSPSNILEAARANENSQIILTESSDSGDNTALFYARRSRGTSLTSPTAIQSGNFMGGLAIGAHNGSSYQIGVRIVGHANQNWTTSAQGSYMVFRTTSDNAVGDVERLRITSSGDLIFNPNGNTSYFYVNQGTGADGGLLFRRNSSNRWQVASSTPGDNLLFYSYGISNPALTLNYSTGAATFSNSVTIGTGATSNTDIRIQNTTNGKTHFIFSDSVTGELGIESGASVGIKFNTNGPNTRMVLTSDAYLRMASGTGGIQFNGDTAAANALDDYEEGTWTPVIGGTGGESGQTYNGTPTGHYTKIGRQVTVTFRVVLSNKGTITGSAAIKGLPFTVKTDGNSYGAGVTYFENLATSWSSIFLMATGGETYATIDGIKTAATLTTRATTSDIGNSTQFNGSLTYFV